MESLLTRINNIETKELRSDLCEAIFSKYRPPTDLLEKERLYQMNRDTLSNYIFSYLARRSVSMKSGFANKIYCSFNPRKGLRKTTQPLLQICYGMNIADTVPDKIFQELHEWEGLYFIPGLWDGVSNPFIGKKFTKKNLNAWSLAKTIAWTIEKGVISLSKYEKNLGKKLPHKDIILEECINAQNPNYQMF